MSDNIVSQQGCLCMQSPETKEDYAAMHNSKEAEPARVLGFSTTPQHSTFRDRDNKLNHQLGLLSLLSLLRYCITAQAYYSSLQMSKAPW